MQSGSSKTDLMYEILYNWEFVPNPSPKVNVKTMVVDGKNRYFMKNHIIGTLYELDELSCDIWSLLNGKRNMATILEDMQRTHPDAQPITILQTILFFAESGALQAVLEQVTKKRARVESVFKVYITIVESSAKFLGSIHKVIRPLLRRWLLWISLAFIGIVGLAFAGQFLQILGDKSRFEILGSSIVGLLVYNFIILAPVTAIHEIAHGLTVIHYGGKPKDMGTGWFYFGPMFYCDATDAWTFSRRKRIMVMLAGNLSTMLIGSAIVVAFYVWTFSPSISITLSMTAFWCFYTALWNFAPPFETDGYYVLSDLLNMPNLRHDSYTYLKNVIKRPKKPVEELEGYTTRKKRILLGYAVLSIVWLIYMAYQSSTLMRYMAQDATTSALKIASAFMFSQTLSIAAFIVSIASIAYFTMMVSGYGFIFVMAVKKATSRALRFEAIHDRDLAVFLYLPTQVPESMANKLKTKITREAKKFTPNFNIKQVGPLCIAVLRLGGKELALVQVKEHLRKMEQKFNSAYQKFLQSHRYGILRSAGIYSPQKTRLTGLLTEMAKQSAMTGTSEAKGVVEEAIKNQAQKTIYLLNSASGKVWTIELPPAQQYEILKTLLPTLSAEDLSITDLYDEAEDFKKRIIYGFDSLAKLAVQSQAGLSKALEHSEKYHIVAFFQPVKGRLIFVGRTEQIENHLDSFGSLFVDQAWFSYMDNLLSETNHMLTALGQTKLPTEEEIQNMSDAELTVLNKNLSAFVACESFIESSFRKCEMHLQTAINNIEKLKKSVELSTAFEIGLLDAIFSINVENQKNLPRRLKNFRESFQKLCMKVKKIRNQVEKEHKERKVTFSNKRTKMIRIYLPMIVALSVILALIGIQPSMESMKILFLSAALFPQLGYWTIYLLSLRAFNKLSHYSSSTFDQIHVFIFALTQTFYNFVATGDILTPTETITFKQLPMNQ